jgi:hypothetical protein
MKVEKLSFTETQRLRSIVGTTIVGFRYINEDEGTFVLELSDGREITFSSTGDDATCTMFNIVPRGTTK